MQSQITTLKNGLRIITADLPQLESVSVGLWVNTGSAYEQEENNGISHFLEHMSFKGTTTRTACQLSEEIEDAGGQSNAYTAREFTAYYAKMLKNDIELAVDVLTDSLKNSIFPEEELQKEREVVVQEIKQTIDAPDDIIFDYFQETAFPNQAIGRSILGTKEKVRSFNKEILQNYLDANYGAENMVACAVGNVNHQSFVKMIEDRLGDYKTHTSFTADKQEYQGGFFAETRAIEQAHVALGFKGLPYKTEDYYPTMLLASMLGGGMSSRLFQEIREKRGLAYTVYSFAASHTKSGMFGIYAGTGAKDLKSVVPVIADELRKICNDKFTDKELLRAKTQMKASMLMVLENPSSTAEMLARQMLIYGRIIPVEEMVQRIERVSLDDVQRLARQIFSSQPTYALLGAVDERIEYDELCRLLK
ncbi:MAG: insulinase family protein [Alphaproteobacteria bacterium]|nr:insulinase family protein [Alphaproteobacteria bacterium]